MAQTLTTTQESLAAQTTKNLILILEIEGVETIYSSGVLYRNWKIGDAGIKIGDPELKIGGRISEPNGRSLIDASKSQKNISQQLEVEQGGSGSLQSINIALTDYNGEITRLVSPGYEVDEILGREAVVYVAFEGGSHPEDSFRLFQGVIDTTTPAQGYVNIRVAHAQKLEDIDLFIPATAELIGEHDDTVTTLALTTVENFHLPVSGDVELDCFVKIDDEIIQYTDVFEDETTFELRNCTRGMFGTTAATHDDDAEVQTIFKLKGNAIDLFLAILLSDGELIADNFIASAIGHVSEFQTITNAIFFEGVDLYSKYGIVEGDLVELQGCEDENNDFLFEDGRVIESIGKSGYGSYIVVSGAPLTNEISEAITCSIKSQFDVLPVGCGLKSKMVDIEQILAVGDVVGAGIAQYDFDLSEEVNAKEFITQQICMPSGLFQVPRVGKVSLDSTLPSIAGATAVVLNENNILNPDKLKITRSINKHFYNGVFWKYGHDVVTEKPSFARFKVDAESLKKFGKFEKILKLESFGLKKTQATKSLIELQSSRLLERYKNGAEFLSVDVNFATGFNIDIADTVILDGRNLKIADTRNGTRNFSPRVMQVINKDMRLSSTITLTLLDTSFSEQGRFTVIGPSSKILTGSTSERLLLGSLFKDLDTQDSEKRKWEERYTGERILVKNDDYSIQAETRIIGFDPQNTRAMLVSPALPFIPTAGMIATMPKYDESDDSQMQIYKELHGFINFASDIVTSIDNKSFEVEPEHVARFEVNKEIAIRKLDYSDYARAKIENITGNLITLVRELDFTPDTSHIVERLVFADGGSPYLIL
ncbi:hypothetical protein [Kangiella sp.]|uniref:hypothetical protein n=1 Tax=Kangiella sp. TaxID=1920245 RepID=UPI003A95694D